MGHPELNSDESIILATQNVVVKSVPFEAILTSERLILVNSKDTLMPPQYLPLTAVRGLETGENAIRDPVITLSVSAEGAGTRQMVLTFSRQAGGERKRESDEWVKVIEEQIALNRARPVQSPASSPDSEREYSRDRPVTPPAIGASGQTGKKKIEIARPMKKIIETVPAPKKPVETSSLPQGSFCSRCGSRVPPDSAFCNRCGTRVASAEKSAMESPASPSPVIPQVSVPLPPEITGGAIHKDRPIEDVIHSIEPLIEDSKPRTQPSPLVPSRHSPAPSVVFRQDPAPVVPEAAPALPAEEDSVKKNLEMFSNILVSSGTGSQPETPVVTELVPAAAPVGSPVSPGQSNGKSPLVSPPPPKTGPKIPRTVAMALVVVVILAIAGGAFLFMKTSPGAGTTVVPTVIPTETTTPGPTTVVTTVTPTPEPTAIAVTLPPTPQQPVIPATGVWVRAKYEGNYTGSFGTPGALREVSDTGDHIYQVPAINSIITASFTKDDGSASPILVEVYYNGVVIKSDSTSTPRGIAQIQVDLKMAAKGTPAPAPTT